MVLGFFHAAWLPSNGALQLFIRAAAHVYCLASALLGRFAFPFSRGSPKEPRYIWLNSRSAIYNAKRLCRVIMWVLSAEKSSLQWHFHGEAIVLFWGAISLRDMTLFVPTTKIVITDRKKVCRPQSLNL